MPTVTYWARADSVTANNSNLNPIGTNGANGFPATQITFTDDLGGGSFGDIVLEQNGGQPDPDTKVIINGVSYNFTVELIGALPGNSQVPASLVGKEVALIKLVVDGKPLELFFVVDGTATQSLMNAVGNGAIPLGGVNTTPPPILICFCADSDILTPSGYRKVETLRSGDMVLNDQGEAKPLIWVGSSTFSLAAMKADPGLQPIRISAGAIAANIPETDLDVSPQHRVVLEGAMAELMFSRSRVLVAAKHLVGEMAEVVTPDAPISYYHLLLEEHEILVSNGLSTESFQPARRTLEAMSRVKQVKLIEVLEALGLEQMLERKDALRSLKRSDAVLLAKLLASAETEGIHDSAMPRQDTAATLS